MTLLSNNEKPDKAQQAVLDDVKAYRALATSAERIRVLMAAAQNRLLDTGVITVDMTTGAVSTDSTRLDDSLLAADIETADLTVDVITAAFSVHIQADRQLTGTPTDRSPRQAINRFIAAGK